MKTKAIGLFLIASGLMIYSNIVLANDGSSVHFDLTFASDDNLNLSPDKNLAVDDTSTTANISIGSSEKLNDTSMLNLNLNASLSRFQDTKGLDNNAFKLSAAYLYKPGGKFNSPIYTFSTDIVLSDSKTDIRDQSILTAGAAISGRITTTLSARTGVTTTSAESDSRVFDTKSSRFFINADLSLSPSITSYLTYSFISGDSVSTLSLNNPTAETLKVVNQASVIEQDPTFDQNQIAYQLDTKTSVISLGFNYLIAHKQAIDISASMISSEADNNIDYDRLIISLSYLASF